MATPTLQFTRDVFERMGQRSPAVQDLFNRSDLEVATPGPGEHHSVHVSVAERCVAWFPMSEENVVYFHDEDDGPFFVRWRDDSAVIKITAHAETPANVRAMFDKIFQNFLAAARDEAVLQRKTIVLDNDDELREITHAMLYRSIARNIKSLSSGGGPTQNEPCIANTAKTAVTNTLHGARISARVLADAIVDTKLNPSIVGGRAICPP